MCLVSRYTHKSDSPVRQHVQAAVTLATAIPFRPPCGQAPPTHFGALGLTRSTKFERQQPDITVYNQS